MKKLLRAALAGAVAGTMGIMGATSASAHATTVSGVAECAVDGTIDITWTVTNDFELEAYLTGESTGGGTITGLPTRIAAGSPADPAEVTVTQSGVPVGVPSASLTVHASWDDYFEASATAEIDLPRECTPPTTPVTPVAPEISPSEECDVPGTVKVPSTEGVRYVLDGKDVSGTTLTGPAKGVIVAEAEDGFTFPEGATTEFPFDVPAAEECAPPTTPVTPVAPSIVQSEECDVPGTATVPTTEGIRYMLEGEDVSGKTLTGPLTGVVVAEPKDGFTIAKAAVVEFPIDLAAAAVCVAPVAPAIEQSDECEVNGTVTIPEVKGVTYYVVTGEDEAEEVEPGTYEGPADVLIVAEAAEGYELTGTSEWEVVLTEAQECEEEPTTPTTPTEPTQPAQPSYPPLAQTGANDTTALLGGLAASLMALGGGLVLFTRRRALSA